MLPLVKTTVGGKRASWPTGGDALLEQAPTLKDDVERVIASVVKSLQVMAGAVTKIEGMTKGLAPAQLRDILAARRPDTVAALIDCPAVPCTILALLDAPLVHAIVELLSGGIGNEPPPEAAREATAIDQQFAQIAVTLTASAMQKEWAERGFGTMRALKLDGDIAADVCGPRVQEVGLVSVGLVVFGIEGNLRLVLPPQALERFGQVTAVVETALTTSVDPIWTDRLQSELGRTAVRIDAYLDAKEFTLASIADLRVGQIIALPADTRNRATLVCDGRALYRGEVGQADDRYSLRIDDIISDVPPPQADARAARPLSPLVPRA